jgi:hypothetical protein
MTEDEIEAVFARVRKWPLEKRSQVAAYLQAIEKQGSDYWPLTDEEIAELVEADAEASRGGVATDDEIVAAFGRPLR